MSRSAAPVRRRILVTGASSGLGEAMALRWAGMGRDLALCARRASELERVRDAVLTAHPERTVTLHPLDVLDHEAVETVFDAAVAAHGGLDRVVVNAGVASGRRVGAGDGAGNRTTAGTNFVGALHQAEAAVRIFRGQGHGHLVFVSSMAAVRGLGGSMTVYAASKAGVSHLAEGLRSDLWDTAVRVTAVHPGYIRTDLTAGLSRTLFISGLDRGVDAMVSAVEREPATAHIPAWPWAVLAPVMRRVPLGVFRRMAG